MVLSVELETGRQGIDREPVRQSSGALRSGALLFGALVQYRLASQDRRLRCLPRPLHHVADFVGLRFCIQRLIFRRCDKLPQPLAANGPGNLLQPVILFRCQVALLRLRYGGIDAQSFLCDRVVAVGARPDGRENIGTNAAFADNGLTPDIALRQQVIRLIGALPGL